MNRSAGVFLVAFGLGCSQVFAPPDTGLGDGVIEYNGTIEVSLPSNVLVGDTFSVAVTTWQGLGFAVGKGETRVTVDGRRVTIAPIDRYGPKGPQLGLAQRMQHEALLSFPNPGLVTVDVVGRRWPGYEPMRRRFVLTVH